MRGIRIRRLRLVGTTRNYDVSFVPEPLPSVESDGGDSTVASPTVVHPFPLSVITGEISTGKTSVLEFIDFALGGRNHPKHQEVQRQARALLVEVEVDGEVRTVERTLFVSEKFAFIHDVGIDHLDEPHAKQRKRVGRPSESDSISSYLLEACGLAGISLKEAPTQEQSGTDPLSIRDLMWLSFLENDRMDSKQLLHESAYMEHLKLQQVVEVVFGVHDDQLAKLSQAITEAEARKSRLEAELASLTSFLEEQEVPSSPELEARARQLIDEQIELAGQLGTLDHTMRAHSNFADDLRQKYGRESRSARELTAHIRDRTTLLQRLLPLRAQYAEDEDKLTFYDEAKTLFDPLRIVTCPACLQALDGSVEIDKGDCSLCGNHVAPTIDAIDVSAELNAVRLRQREVSKYINEVEANLDGLNARYAKASVAEKAAQQQLDATVAQDVAPFVAERDLLVRQAEARTAAQAAVRKQIEYRKGVARRQLDLATVERQIASLRKEHRKRKEGGTTRAEVVKSLSARFHSILSDFGFPKLDDPQPAHLDDRFIPHARGLVYRDLGSAGAKTLISVAWYLTLFELAAEDGAAHPGFLMIDSPQKNLRPPSGTGDEYQTGDIVSRVWKRLIKSANDFPRHQLIVVENRPPDFVKTHVVMEYSGDVNRPPYGLIDNELPSSTS